MEHFKVHLLNFHFYRSQSFRLHPQAGFIEAILKNDHKKHEFKYLLIFLVHAPFYPGKTPSGFPCHHGTFPAVSVETSKVKQSKVFETPKICFETIFKVTSIIFV